VRKVVRRGRRGRRRKRRRWEEVFVCVVCVRGRELFLSVYHRREREARVRKQE